MSPEMLHEFLRYDSESGKLFWRHRPLRFFKGEKSFRIWNYRFAGKEAFSIGREGYRSGTILGKRLQSHRVIWAMHYGEWPKGEIDHINGVNDDNRISNLRDVTHLENMRNTQARIDNNSGVMGVSWHKSSNRWRARIGVNGVEIHIGSYMNKEDAIKARSQAVIDNEFHENHGKEAKL